MPACPRRFLLVTLPLALGLPAAAAKPDPPASGTALRTGKERMRDKAADEQRVNDCKVPPERRTRPRPDACPGQTHGEPANPPGR